MNNCGWCSEFLSRRRTLLALLFLSLIGFLLVLIFRNNFGQIDRIINLDIALNQNTFLVEVALILNNAFNTVPVLLIASAIVIFLYLDRQKKYSILLASAMLGEWLMTTIVKAATHVTRPENAVVIVNEFAFPSGHVMTTAVLFGVLLYVISKRWRSRNGKIILIIFLVLLSLSVGASRLYLNVHWFSDILGAYLLAALWISVSILVFEFVLLNVETLAQKKTRARKNSK
jgi:undecaprenyl-diphosphatase